MDSEGKENATVLGNLLPFWIKTNLEHLTLEQCHLELHFIPQLSIVGHFCPNRTVSDIQNPCPAGTYNDGWGLSSEDECLPCLGTIYHPVYEFWSSGSHIHCLCWSVCWVSAWNAFCLSGGFYCPGGGVIYPSLPCAAGFYCQFGAEVATPTGSPNADECPPGHYCPENSTDATKCPSGTFSNQTRLQEEVQCNPCTPGGSQKTPMLI